ncbi:MAG: TetR/AcrR family transcriptional regulator [Telmatospirillum sp.]|nr:TetR/AcrR family transcriptional regulator [Telmatospirillum sp.]
MSVENRPQSCRNKEQQIRAAARDLFMAQGYRPTSMDQIAQKADVSKTTLYAYFASKEALFVAMINEEKRRLGLFVPETLPDGPVDAREVLMQMGRGMIRLHCDRAAMGSFRTVLAEACQSPELARTMWAEGPSKFLARTTILMAQLAERAGLKIDDPETAAVHFLALVRGDWHLHILMDRTFVPDPAELEKRLVAAVDFFLMRTA